MNGFLGPFLLVCGDHPLNLARFLWVSFSRCQGANRHLGTSQLFIRSSAGVWKPRPIVTLCSALWIPRLDHRLWSDRLAVRANWYRHNQLWDSLHLWRVQPAGGNLAQGMRRRPMQAWVSYSWGRTNACDPPALGGGQCGEQRDPDLEHRTRNQQGCSWKADATTTVSCSGGPDAKIGKGSLEEEPH